jgi:DnaJ-class molecular chaperone
MNSGKCEKCKGRLIKKAFCKSCLGAGYYDDDYEDECVTCHGMGVILANPEYEVILDYCPKCRLIYVS